jgi:hypothetical protein
MEPLDLTQRPPRSCREELGGIIFLPRAIDKVRAELPGGNIGAYLNLSPDVPTMSSLFYRRLGITHEEFVAAVAEAPDDDAVATWLHARIEPTAPTKLKSQMLSIHLGDLPAESLPTVHHLYPAAATSPSEMLLIDLIDADDTAVFATQRQT